ncbi:MAG: UDP-N-acetylmuramate--L-alanine ligase [Anaerolineae bacterium]|nr:UDP-N-acetylmuramate--L-alanine ligase [Anaerolineae bacterium]
MLTPGQHVHIVGVGGFGMSAIARVLLQMGYPISGSDMRANDFTRALATLGATIYQGHTAEHIAGADVVLATSAATDDNPEIAAARAAGLPVLRRRDMLGALTAHKTCIAIAGTHGKTTTTAMLAHVLIEAGHDPSYIVGGVMANTGTNAHYGQGDHFVIEADEYDRMFLGLNPQIAIVTNVEHDHVDCFLTPEIFRAAFEEFIARLPQNGLLIVCADDSGARALGQARAEIGGAVVLYGVGEGVLPYTPAWRANDLTPTAEGGVAFTIQLGDQELGRARLPQPGQHNVQNALAVITVADHLGVPFEQIAAALATFGGTGRRAEVMGQANGVTVINDYAHHPTEIRVTLNAFAQRPGLRKLWAVWQPHTYGRLRQFADEFAAAFTAADHVLITDVYSVREQVTPGLDAADMAARIKSGAPRDVRYTGTLDATADALAGEVQPGDVVVLLSAGNAPRIGTRLLERLRERE